MPDVRENLERVRERIARAAARAGRARKGGFAPGAVGGALEAIAKLSHVKVTGLMAIPPEVARPEDARPWFRGLREEAERHGLQRLSMGMSGDFEVAVEEGATMVRVGTAIFGSRPPLGTRA